MNPEKKITATTNRTPAMMPTHAKASFSRLGRSSYRGDAGVSAMSR